MIALIALGFRPMPKPERETHHTIMYLRGTPRELARKLKAAAALQGKSLTQYVQQVLGNHVEELEKKGLLPKGK